MIDNLILAFHSSSELGGFTVLLIIWWIIVDWMVVAVVYAILKNKKSTMTGLICFITFLFPPIGVLLAIAETDHNVTELIKLINDKMQDDDVDYKGESHKEKDS